MNYIFAASVEQIQKWDQEIIGLYVTVKDGTRSFSILIQNARYVKVQDMTPEDLGGEGFLDSEKMSFEVRLSLIQRVLFRFYNKCFGVQDYVCVVKYRK
jgi:hypothetical protein